MGSESKKLKGLRKGQCDDVQLILENDFAWEWMLPSTDGGVIAEVSPFSLLVARSTPSKQLVTGSLQFPHNRPNFDKWWLAKEFVSRKKKLIIVN